MGLKDFSVVQFLQQNGVAHQDLQHAAPDGPGSGLGGDLRPGSVVEVKCSCNTMNVIRLEYSTEVRHQAGYSARNKDYFEG